MFAILADGFGAFCRDRGRGSAFDAGAERVLVATATADVDNLRFYQRHGLRMDRIERDVFTVERGYPPALVPDGIPGRDLVWLSVTRDERGLMERT